MAEHTHKTDGGWGGGFALSLLLHAGLAGLAVYGAMLGHYLPLGGSHKGDAAPGAIQANLVETVPGGTIPMPSPTPVVTKNRLANDTPGTSVSKPPREAAVKNSVALLAFRPEELAKQQAQADLRRLARPDQAKPDQRVPYGAGGPASFSYTTGAQGSGGSGGMAFGDANFGALYTAWVNHLRDRLAFYWNLQPRSPSLPVGSDVVVILTVSKAGVITATGFAQRSRSADLDNLAFHSVQQLGAAEQIPLPADYQHSSLEIRVTFGLK